MVETAVAHPRSITSPLDQGIVGCEISVFLKNCLLRNQQLNSFDEKKGLPVL
jgi:hypothetical protein